jgi:hypothetical protein
MAQFLWYFTTTIKAHKLHSDKLYDEMSTAGVLNENENDSSNKNGL